MHAASANHAADVNPVQAYPHNIWAGNIADQPTGPNTQTDHTYHYSEIDSDWYVPALSGSNTCGTCGDLMWVGLGGNGNSNLVQGGSWSGVTFGVISYGLWYQNYAVDAYTIDVSSDFNGGNIHYGLHLYVRVDSGDCVEIGDIDTQEFHSWCHGPNASNQTAEAVMERAQGFPYTQVGSVLARWASATFKGVGITEDYINGPVKAGYWGFPHVWHDFFKMYNCTNCTLELATPAALVNDPSDPPGDDSPINWLNYGG